MSQRLLFCVIFICVALRYHLLDYKAIRYNEYLRRFNKSYGAEEYKKRLQYFEESLAQINKQVSVGHSTGAVYRHTKFSDWSEEEFLSLMLKDTPDCTNTQAICMSGRKSIVAKSTRSLKNVSGGLDWRREQGVISPVPDQKQCNGCWAFGIVGVMQSMAAIKQIGYDQLSVQELIDCTDNKRGCHGGNIISAMTSLCYTRFKITTEDKYPLMLVDEPCRLRPSEGRGLSSFAVYCNLSDAAIMKKLLHGPVMAVVKPATWKNYYSGIITHNCYDVKLEYVHVVQIVGYNSTDGIDTDGYKIPYFIIKNSWGADWGEDGYIRIAMGSNLCGLNDMVGDLDVN